MEPLSIISNIRNTIKNVFTWFLKRRGLKIVPIDEYKDETVKIRMDYTEKSPQCIQERENGATFYLSEYQNPNYEKYFEIEGNTRRYFWNDSKQYLWIKRIKQ